MRPLPVTLLALSCTFAGAQDVAQLSPDKEAERIFREGEKVRERGRYQEAIDLYTQALATDRECLNAYLQRGWCHSMQKNYQAAVADFSAIIERKSDHIWAYTSRGSAYNKLGQHDRAMRDFDTAIGLDPKDQEAYNNRGWVKKALGDTEGACRDWKTSKKLGNAEARIILENNRCK